MAEFGLNIISHGDWESGDIVCACDDNRIGWVHAEQLCHVRYGAN